MFELPIPLVGPRSLNRVTAPPQNSVKIELRGGANKSKTTAYYATNLSSNIIVPLNMIFTVIIKQLK